MEIWIRPLASTQLPGFLRVGIGAVRITAYSCDRASERPALRLVIQNIVATGKYPHFPR